MQYIYSDHPTKQAASALATSITSHLQYGKRVLWLLSGGSGIDIAIKTQELLSADLDLTNLYVSLTDERFGDLNHADENWSQLVAAGLKLPGAHLYRPLLGQDVITTTQLFNNWLGEQFSAADYKIGVFGIGTDSHTAGIKPWSEPKDMQDYAYSFKAEDFERITISSLAIKRLDEAVIQASGDNKLDVIRQLLDGNYPVNIRPAQILKSVKLSSLYTDQKIEEAK